MEDIPSELSKDNLEEFLHNDNAFVDYFNTFLSLPCFPERIFYNKESDLLEQFTQQLVKDESDNVQLRYGSSSNKVQISYCVTVLDNDKALEWLKTYRLPEFFKSGLYAEYKLSKILSASQAIHNDTIKEDLLREKSAHVGSQVCSKFTSGENSKCLEDDFFLSDDCNTLRHFLSDTGNIEEILNDYEKASNHELDNQVSISTEHSSNVPTVANNHELGALENGNKTARKIQDEAEYSKILSENFKDFLSVIVNDTDASGGSTSEIGEDVGKPALTRYKFGHKKVDDVVKLNDSSNDIEASCMKEDVIDNDVNLSGDDVISINKSTIEYSHDKCDILTTFCAESHALKTEGMSSSNRVIDSDNSTENQEECLEAERSISKDKTEFWKCFHESHVLGSGKMLPNRHEETSISFENETSPCKISRTNQGRNKSSKETTDITNCTRLSTTKDISIDTSVDIDNFSEEIESNSFLFKIPVPTLTLDTFEQCTLNEKNTQNQINSKESNSDTTGLLVDKSYSLETLGVISKSDANTKYDNKSINESLNGTNAKIGENKMPQERGNTTTVNNVKKFSLDVVKHSKVMNVTSHNIDSVGKIKENKILQDAVNNAAVDKSNNLQSDVKPLKMEDTASHITSSGRENHLLGTRSFRKRASSLESNASSETTVERVRKLSIAEQKVQDKDMLDEVNLASKEGMDKFKEFLINTKGEALLLFWLQVETLKHLGNKADKIRVLQEMKEQFLRNGSPLELPNEIKKQARCFAADLNETQRIISEPLRYYWCPRFTLHQFKTRTRDEIQQNDQGIETEQNSRSAEIHSRSCSPCVMYPSSSPHLVRPHSSTPREASHSSSPRETLVEGKTHSRSKSAQGRIVTTPCHTNAGKRQLEIYANPPPAEFGYQKRPISTFPPCDDEEYLSSVRLVITPRCKPKLRTAWPQSQEENRKPPEAYITKSHDNVHHDSLLGSLMYQTESGCFFKEFVSKKDNQLSFNCLLFWQAVMDYTACFESDTLNPVTVSKKAQWIYARFIAPGSICDIKVERKIHEDVRKKLDPPYEELFDCVEDHVLKCLKEPWDSLCRNERREYDMIPKKETVRYLEVELKQTRGRSKNSFLQEELDSQDGRENAERGKYSIDEANNPTPTPQDGISFESVIKDREELEGFQKFLEKKDPKGVTDLMAWTDMETFQRIPRTMEEKRNKKAKEIRQGYLNSRYFFGPDSPATKEAQNLILSMNGSSRIKERPSSSVITECQKYVRCRIERRWLVLYKASEEYTERQNPTQNVSDVVEDIMLRRRLQRSEAAWRVLNSRWVSSSRDIVALRQTLNNPESCLAFKKFVALKGDTYENDVLFWIEIQKYKDLCHRHASEQCIKKKIQAITECFITSSIPPELQVDVPIEMAEKLMERITSRNQNIGPYLFREVQTTVFRVLFNMWKDFCSFRSAINDESLLKILEQRLTQHRAEARAKKEASERKKLAKQEAEKKKKEKEEKEKKELKSMEQLMSLMTETSPLEQEENDVVLWKYSKHMSAMSEPALARKKISTQDDTASFMELANQRSVATKSTNQITNSLRSERNTNKVSNSKHIASLLAAESIYSTRSKYSMKETNSTTSRIPRINQPGRASRVREIKRYDITDKNSPEKKMTDMRDKKQRSVEKNKLLKNREQKKSKMLLDLETVDSASNVERLERATSQTGNKHGKVKSPGSKDLELKSREKTPTIERPKINGSDDVSMMTGRHGSLRTNLLRRQLNQSHDRTGLTVPLTSQRLKDFTNSPEGAPLDSPLSLARINTSDDVKFEKSTDISRKPAQRSLRTLKQSNTMSWRNKRANLRRYDIEQFVPDVIVN